ncbi:MAG: hypothetical protein HY868_03760 [Chloroflexi bacterium]|nr:hypothetical protein [Chloroflexota bacterium]
MSKQSASIVRVRPLGLIHRKQDGNDVVKTYRVVLRINVTDGDIRRIRGEEELGDMKQDTEDYLRDYVENEMGWLGQSFSRVETESVRQLREIGRTPEILRKSKK